MDSASTGNRQERRKEETRKKIIAAAKSLFDRQGFNVTTVEQIAEKADVAKKTLYNHFPVKEAILAEIIAGATSGLDLASIDKLKNMPDTRTRIIQLFNQLLEMALKQEDFFLAYFAYRMYNKFQLSEDQSIKSGGHEILEEIIKLGQQSGELRTDLPIKVFLNHLEMVLAITITDIVRRKDDLVLEKCIEENVDIFLYGVSGRG